MPTTQLDVYFAIHNAYPLPIFATYSSFTLIGAGISAEDTNLQVVFLYQTGQWVNISNHVPQEAFYWSINCSKLGFESIIGSNIENSPYSLIFATQFNDSSVLITIILWDYLF